MAVMFLIVLWITFSLKTCYFSNNHKMAVYIFIVKFFSIIMLRKELGVLLFQRLPSGTNEIVFSLEKRAVLRFYVYIYAHISFQAAEDYIPWYIFHLTTCLLKNSEYILVPFYVDWCFLDSGFSFSLHVYLWG